MTAIISVNFVLCYAYTMNDNTSTFLGFVGGNVYFHFYFSTLWGLAIEVSAGRVVTVDLRRGTARPFNSSTRVEDLSKFAANCSLLREGDTGRRGA